MSDGSMCYLANQSGRSTWVCSPKGSCWIIVISLLSLPPLWIWASNPAFFFYSEWRSCWIIAISLHKQSQKTQAAAVIPPQDLPRIHRSTSRAFFTVFCFSYSFCALKKTSYQFSQYSTCYFHTFEKWLKMCSRPAKWQKRQQIKITKCIWNKKYIVFKKSTSWINNALQIHKMFY